MREKREPLMLTEKGKGSGNNISVLLLRIVSTMCLTAGLTAVLFGSGGTSVYLLPAAAAALWAAVIPGLDFVTGGKGYGTMACLITAAGLFFFSGSAVVRGICGWVNEFRGLWNQVFGTFYGQLAATGYTWRDARTAALVLSLLSSTAVCELVRRKRLFLLTAAAFLPLCFAMVLRLRLPFWAPAVVAAGWLGLWCSVSGPAEIRWETVVLAAGAAGILCVLPTLFTGVLWQNASWEFRTHIKDSIEKLRFGEDTLPGGNLVRADRMTSGTEARLELEMEAAAPVYLRGFVGSVLENNQWKPFDADAYEGDFSGMLSWLAKQNFYPGEQYAEYAAAFPEQSSEKLLKVSVKNTGASRRYIYLPATAAESTGVSGRWKQDWSMEASRWFGEKNYGFSYYDTQNNAEVQLPGSRRQRISWMVSSGRKRRKCRILCLGGRPGLPGGRNPGPLCGGVCADQKAGGEDRRDQSDAVFPECSRLGGGLCRRYGLEDRGSHAGIL